MTLNLQSRSRARASPACRTKGPLPGPGFSRSGGFAGHVAHPGGGVHLVGEVAPLQPQGHVDQADKDRHLHQGADHRGKGLAAVNAEHGHGHGDGQLKVVRGGGEAQGGGLLIGGPGLEREPEAGQEHHHKVDAQGQSHPQHVQGQLHDVLALEGEHHQDGEQQGHQGDGADAGDELLLVPGAALELEAQDPAEDAGHKGDAQIDEHALGDLADGHIHLHALHAQPFGQHGDKKPGVEGEEQHLEDAVKGHQAGAVLGVAPGQVVPHDDHGDAAGQADENQAHHVLLLAREKGHGQGEHEHRANDPVLHQGQGQHLYVAEDRAQLLVAHLGQGRVHHQDQADGDGQVGGAHREMVHDLTDAGIPVAPGHPHGHGQEDPQSQEAVQEGELFNGGVGHGGSPGSGPGGGRPSGQLLNQPDHGLFDLVADLASSGQLLLVAAGELSRVVKGKVQPPGDAREQGAFALPGAFAHRDHVLEDASLPEQLEYALGLLVADVEALLGHHLHGQGVQGAGLESGALHCKAFAGHLLHIGLGDLGTGAVVGANEKYPLAWHNPLLRSGVHERHHNSDR
eukprot:TRINITY_DN2694_c2_g1_i2.p1 TRINITY_DN2694_c2_g1~~TRINITY_DN2694_c2_g1_i2.p1  ORF type:complete len:569 (-),score=155.47 TRINITY_DN2694_c2_g1_i2:132-1838(-)